MSRLADDDLVLDVGGGASPFSRADWVLDLLAYEDRAWYGEHSGARERFGAQTWVQRDICDRQPWPFADRQFDFAVCSHTLEDVRDPVWVCAELQRVARAGYIEVPSRLEEQSWGVHGPWVGWSHHRWLCDVRGETIDFVFKSAVVHGRSSDHFPPGFASTLTDQQRVQQLWWEGSLQAEERIFTRADDLDSYVEGFVTAHRPPLGRVPVLWRARRGLVRALGRGLRRRMRGSP